MDQRSTRDLHLKRNHMWDASMENHKRYLNPDTGLFDDAFMEQRACPVCGGENAVAVMRKSGGVYCRCKECAMLFLDPVMKDRHLEDYYRNNHDMQSEIVRNDGAFYEALYGKGLDLIEGDQGGSDPDRPKSLLDIGCSAGGFLDIARHRGYRTFGLELNAKEASVCRGKGHSVFESTIAGLDEGLVFDVITLWDVFEHIKDGKTLLAFAARHLTGSGAIFIQSPTQDSLAARILREKCNMFDGLEHVNIYSHRNIRSLATRCGLEVRKLQTVIAEDGVIANYLDFQDPYFGQVDESALVRTGLVAESILADGLGYKFQVLISRQ